jgi:hypothetical protein
MTRSKPFLAAALLAGLTLLASGPVRAETWGLGSLMQALAQTTSSRATFVEKKYMAALDTPLESSGELVFVAPDRLEKRTLQPKAESMVLDKSMLTLERGGRKRSLPLQSYPEIGAFVESIRATLAGDQAALERHYQIELGGKAERWTLKLKPIDPKMGALVKNLSLSGVRDRVDVIEIMQADGDRSVMSITPAANPPATSGTPG